MKTVEERLRSYEPLWENWTYTGEFLGEGAMSSVFEIQSTAMGMREVAALKIITVKKNMLGEVEIPENALNEIKILRELSGCPNIVHYHDSTQRQIYDSNNVLSEIDILIKMEKLRSLSEGDELSEKQIIKLGMDMCNALVHASEHNIIHRDIKPQNIFVDDDGNYKLGDFGIAKIVSGFSQHYTMNIGTMAYTAPEVQSSITGTYDISSDIYSLGLVLYVFLNNGCLPFVNGSTSLHNAIAKRLSGAPFPSPAKGSKNLKSIVMRACSNDLAKRYKNPKEMLDDFKLLSTGGKKMVVDPFATLDANIDVVDIEPTVLGGFTSKSGGTSSSGRLKINFAGNPGEKTEDKVIPADKKPKDMPGSASTGSRLKINMARKSSPGSAEYKNTVVPSGGSSSTPSSTGSRLKINMKSKTSGDAVKPATKVTDSNPVKEVDTKKTTAGKDTESLFSTPDSI